MGEFICKKASIADLNKYYDDKLVWAENKELIILSKKEAPTGIEDGSQMVYVGKLDGKIITQARIIVRVKEGEHTRNYSQFVGNGSVYSCDFVSEEDYRGKGYFSKLHRFIENDMKSKGYKKMVVGVEASNERNIAIYKHLGYENFIKTICIEKIDYETNQPCQKHISYYYKNI